MARRGLGCIAAAAGKVGVYGRVRALIAFPNALQRVNRADVGICAITRNGTRSEDVGRVTNRTGVSVVPVGVVLDPGDSPAVPTPHVPDGPIATFNFFFGRLSAARFSYFVRRGFFLRFLSHVHFYVFCSHNVFGLFTYCRQQLASGAFSKGETMQFGKLADFLRGNGGWWKGEVAVETARRGAGGVAPA